MYYPKSLVFLVELFCRILSVGTRKFCRNSLTVRTAIFGNLFIGLCRQNDCRLRCRYMYSSVALKTETPLYMLTEVGRELFPTISSANSLRRVLLNHSAQPAGNGRELKANAKSPMRCTDTWSLIVPDSFSAHRGEYDERDYNTGKKNGRPS